jgi:hypothetical protein
MTDNFQVKFMETIISFHSKKTDAIDALCQLLNVGKDSIYRRLRGDTLLSPQELNLLANKYNLSLDKMMNLHQNEVLFTFNSFSNKIVHVDDFVNNLIGLLDKFALISEAKMYYASAEIPVFYHCFFSELFSFKLYVWARTVWNLPAYQDKKFHVDLIPYETRQKFNKLIDLYKNLESLELWSLNIFDNTLNQIEYFLEGAMFEQEEDALHLLTALENTCEHMRQMALESKKFNINDRSKLGNSLTLFQNEIAYTNNTILYIAPEFKLLITTFCNPNYILTRDERICEFSNEWFDTIISKSVLISGINEKQRNKYFDNLQRRINLSRKRIEAHIGI